MKPKFFVLKWGPVQEHIAGDADFEAVASQHNIVRGASRIARASSTVGLVAYHTPDGERFMMLDMGMAHDWTHIRDQLAQHGCDDLAKVTHVLQSHWDEDHCENITHFSPYNPACVWGGSGPRHAPQNGRILILGTPYYLQTEEIYPDGYIASPHIRYEYCYRAHSRDEMIFIIESENEGDVAFMGDIVHTPVSNDNIDFLVSRDRLYTLDVFRKLEVLTELLSKYPRVQKFVAGHANRYLSRDDVEDNIRAMFRPEYKQLMREWLDGWDRALVRYRDILAAPSPEAVNGIGS